jgi:hypothetical protein
VPAGRDHRGCLPGRGSHRRPISGTGDRHGRGVRAFMVAMHTTGTIIIS